MDMSRSFKDRGGHNRSRGARAQGVSQSDGFSGCLGLGTAGGGDTGAAGSSSPTASAEGHSQRSRCQRVDRRRHNKDGRVRDRDGGGGHSSDGGRGRSRRDDNNSGGVVASPRQLVLVRMKGMVIGLADSGKDSQQDDGDFAQQLHCETQQDF